MARHNQGFRLFIVCGSSLAALSVSASAVAKTENGTTFNIPAQPLERSLPLYEQQSGERVTVQPSQFANILTNGVRGRLTAKKALDALLAGTGLSVVRDSAGGVTLVDGNVGSSGGGAIPEIVVQGSRSLNVDIQRTRDDTQPYVVFDAKDIAQSQASTAEEFLRTRLPMNTVALGPTQNINTISSQSSIDLRGLGTDQTLILVDGRRRAAPLDRNDGSFGQPDINGIPVAAIERIEVLPSGAGGIYGGGAIGGVVNIILKHSYHGLEAGFTYGDSGDFKVATRRYDLSGGFVIGGSTRVTFSGSHSDGGNLLVGERDFGALGRALQLKNNPSAFYNVTTSVPGGYTTNIRSSTGTNLVLKDGRTLSSPYTYVPVGYVGWGGLAADNVAGLIANAGQYNLGLSNDLNGARRNLMSNPTVWSGNVSVEHDFSDRLRVFVDGTYSKNSATAFTPATGGNSTVLAGAPNNPFNQSISISYQTPGIVGLSKSLSKSIGVTGGLIYNLGVGWSVSADNAWNRATASSQTPSSLLKSTAANAFRAGTLDVLKDLNIYPLDLGAYLGPNPGQLNEPVSVISNDTNLRLSGPLFALPGGNLTLTTLLEHRNQVAGKAYNSFFYGSGTSYNFRPRMSQAVDSAYVELRAPLIGAANHIPLINELVVQASVRHDRYKTNAVAEPFLTLDSRDEAIPASALDPVIQRFQATKFTVGAIWKPIQDIQFRASYATAFLPPAISQISSTVYTDTDFVTDPLRGNLEDLLDLTITDGGNPDLKPEESKSLSFGLILEPRFLSGFRVSADYTRITKTNEILGLDYQTIVDYEASFPGRVTRANPTDADRAAGYAGVITAINSSLVNVARSKVEAVDFQADYTFSVESAGEFRVYAVATWQPTSSLKIFAGDTFVNQMGYDDGPLKWRGNGGITWTKGGLSLGWNAQYYDSYYAYSFSDDSDAIEAAVFNQGHAKIPSQIYNDVFVSYRIGPNGALGNKMLSGVTLGLGIQNVFDKRPPILAIVSQAGGYSQYGDPRLRRFTASVRKSF